MRVSVYGYMGACIYSHALFMAFMKILMCLLITQTMVHGNCMATTMCPFSEMHNETQEDECLLGNSLFMVDGCCKKIFMGHIFNSILTKLGLCAIKWFMAAGDIR